MVAILSCTTAAHGVTTFVAMVVAGLGPTFTLSSTDNVAALSKLPADTEVDAMRKTGLGQGTVVDSDPSRTMRKYPSTASYGICDTAVSRKVCSRYAVLASAMHFLMSPCHARATRDGSLRISIRCSGVMLI